MLPPMRSGRRLCAVALVAALASGSIRGEPAAIADETSPANVAAARRHFDKARAYYAQGAYREAISELEAAHALDPNAKDLVFNLGVVHEKLADIEDALKWFRLYTSMNLTDQERERANAYLKRLEGAKKELDAKQAAAAGSSASAGPAQPPPPPEQPQYGRIDGFTIAAASVAVVGLGTGIVLGVKALSDRPPSNPVTGPNLTYQQLVNKTSQAHNEAIGADIGFGVAVAAAAVTAYLYLARARSTASSTTGSTTVSVSGAPLTGGGAFFVQGSF